MAYSPGDDLSAAAGVLNRHRDALMAIEGVQGVGVTRDRIGNDAVVVYVRDQGVADSVPRSLDGVSVQIEVTGHIDALPAK
jgi:hypothetical protein